MARTKRPAPLPARTLLVALLAGCGGDGTDEGQRAPDVADTSVLILPDTTASSLWDHLVSERYRETWWTWPGKGELYPGREPHGLLLTTYLNFGAHDALSEGMPEMPAGAIVAKESYTPDSTLVGITVMYKSAGFDPAHNDWYWAKYGPGGEVEAAGRTPDCIACHEAAATDFVMTEPVGERAGPGGR